MDRVAICSPKTPHNPDLFYPSSIHEQQRLLVLQIFKRNFILVHVFFSFYNIFCKQDIDKKRRSRTLIRREEREVSHKIFNVIKKWIAKNYYKKIYYIFIQLQKNYLILLILLDNIKEFAIQSQFFHFYLLKTFTTMNNIHKNSYLLQ